MKCLFRQAARWPHRVRLFVVEGLERRSLLSFGHLDPTFGTAGIASSELNGGDVTGGGHTVALLPNGQVIVAGYTPNSDPTLTRFNRDGSVDRTFGNSGSIVTLLPGKLQYGFNSLAVQPDGKFLTATDSGLDTFQFSVLRYLSDGKLDPTFGHNGVSSPLPFFNSFAQNQSLVVEPDGKIVVCGMTPTAASQYSDIAVVRLTRNGTLDGTFGKGGEVITDTGGGIRESQPDSIALAKDGRIVVSGGAASNDPFHTPITVVRYKANGALDPTFGTGGQETLANVIVDNAFGFSTSVQPDGKLLIPTSDSKVARLSASGTLDSTFGQGGFATASSEPYAIFSSVLIQKDGKIIAVSFEPNVVAVRLTPDGKVDPTFGVSRVADSVRYAPVAPGLLQPDGKIILAVDAIDGFALARFSPDGHLDGTYGYHGLEQATNGISGTITAEAVLPDGKILVAGTETSPDPATAPTDAAIARYNSDGTLDTTFAMDGRFYIRIGNNAQFDSLLIQPDGKIVAGGSGEVKGVTEFLLVRLNSDGTYDHGFNSTGVATLGFKRFKSQSVVALALAPGNEIVAAGSADNAFAVARYLPNGHLDPSFVNKGAIAFYPTGKASSLNGVFVRPDGRITLAGTIDNNFGLVRLTVAGRYDTSFGTDGISLTLLNDFGLTASQVTGAAMSAAGDIVLSGTVGYIDPGNVFISYSLLLARYLPDGKPDPTFGTGGQFNYFNVTPDPNFMPSTGIAILPDGNILLAGISDAGSAAIARFTRVGYDPIYGNDGVLELTQEPLIPSPGDVPVNALTLQPDGKALAAVGSDIYRVTTSQRAGG